VHGEGFGCSTDCWKDPGALVAEIEFVGRRHSLAPTCDVSLLGVGESSSEAVTLLARRRDWMNGLQMRTDPAKILSTCKSPLRKRPAQPGVLLSAVSIDPVEQTNGQEDGIEGHVRWPFNLRLMEGVVSPPRAIE
jgi:hypothetical protein